MGSAIQATRAEARDYEELLSCMERYFEAFHHSDADQLGVLFHRDARYTFADGEVLRQMDMATYLPIVADRPAPAMQGARRDDRVVSIAFVGPRTASVVAESQIGARHFVDLLSFLKVEGRWQIVAKVFHVDHVDAKAGV